MDVLVQEISDGLYEVTVGGMCQDGSSAQGNTALAQVKELASKNVLINLEGITMLNSSGVGWLLNCRKGAQGAGGRVIIHSVPTIAMNVLKLMRLDEVFELAKNQQEAIEAVNGRESSV